MSAARDERLYFHLQVAAARLRASADRRCLDHAGVTTAQAAALAVIRDRPGVSQRALAGALRQTEPSITTLVRRLVTAGLVDRRVDPSDGRARTLAITGRGAAALAAADAAFAAVNDHIDAVLSGEEARLVAGALRRLAALRLPGGSPSAP
ncbi:MAG TPA: MarR family winged helix-turn-helix transcriptional regulator [Acidimicrobiales bacterium]